MSEQALACLTDAPTYEHPAGFVPCTDRYGMAEFAICYPPKQARSWHLLLGSTAQLIFDRREGVA